MKALGGLLIAGGIVRLAFATMALVTVSATILFNNPFVLTMSIVVPILLGIAILTAGIMLVAGAAAARSVGIAACAIALAFQLYGLGTTLYRLSTASLPASYPWWTLILSLGYLALYAIGLVLLIRWEPKPQAR
jgi:hypothetical protein